MERPSGGSLNPQLPPLPSSTIPQDPSEGLSIPSLEPLNTIDITAAILKGCLDSDANPEAESGTASKREFQKSTSFVQKYVCQSLFLFLRVLFMVNEGYSQS